MGKYMIRLDDASEYMNLSKWEKIKVILDRYEIKPIYGIIPENMDEELLKYTKVENFWSIMRNWKNSGWIPALHGYNHVFVTNSGGINPVNYKSEFAGVELEKQKEKIREGIKILKSKNIEPKIFFAPAHTFDKNTLIALEEETQIRIISDMIASDFFYENDFYFIPQQSGKCRKLPFKIVTFCYHPNTMSEDDFDELESFLKKYKEKFIKFDESILKKRKRNILDIILEKLYFVRR